MERLRRAEQEPIVMIRRCVLGVVCVASVSVNAFAVDAQFQRHPVSSVPGGDRVVIVYAGLPVTVRLAHVALPASAELQQDARQAVEKLVKGKLVRAAYSPEYGLDENGLPRVFLSAGTKIVNEELVREGLAKYEDGGKPSKFYRTKMASADKAARHAKRGVWASGGAVVASTGGRRPIGRSRPSVAMATVTAPREAAGVVYSELNSSQFHLPTCRWARQMSPQRRIRYKSVESAIKTGKRPCWICLSEQAKTSVFGSGKSGRKVKVLAGKGALVSVDGMVHACNCEDILNRGDDVVTVQTPKEAESAGVRPCKKCLRLAGGEVPLPEKGECIGRAPPHRRPCRRAPADESGLCLYCQGKE
jgi:endonuclease YncB( thermonuclease family)